jgi:tetratricopeptide (TPR) repeat protein
MKSLAILSVTIALGLSNPAFADVCDDGYRALQKGWEQANYQTARSARLGQMQALSDRGDIVLAQCPGRAEPLVWEAIIKATAGGLKGGLGGLALAKEARALLEKAERINPTALEGSVYTSLGSLYAQVPGAPIGFGDKSKARSYLQKALQVSPNGIDPNYFMGDYLLRQRDYQGAIRHLEKAIIAPPRPGRETADRGRRDEARQLLAEARRRAG